MIPDDKKEEVREASDIVEVVGDYVKLKRSGSSYVGLCPFHDENTPSFHVTPRLNIYKCFGCGASGDVFNFIMEMEGIGFNESVRTLADRYQVALPDEEDDEYSEEQYLREGIYHALRFAGVFYYRMLREEHEAEQARQYLQKRGFTQQTIKQYGLGYSPAGGEKLYRAALDAGINEQYLREAGLIKPSQRHEGYYDTFRGRLMFPIFNPTGKVIAFAGRVLKDGDGPKYINSPQTPVYNKSEVVYALHQAKSDIRRKDEAMLVEGYTDVLMLHQNEIKNAVATSGTSITPDQLKALHRYGEKLILVYDADTAGLNAMMRGVDLALTEGLDVRLLQLPEGEDPDSFVRQFGKESFEELKKEESEDFLSFMVHQAQADGTWDDPVGKKNMIDRILRSIARMPDQVARDTFVQYLNQFAKVGDRTLLEKLSRIQAEVKEEQKRTKERERRHQEREKRNESYLYRSEDVKTDSSGRKGKSHTHFKKPRFEKELIRLMLAYGKEMIEYIGSFCNEKQFEDPELSEFFEDIIQRFNANKTISIEEYLHRESPYPELIGEIVVEQYGVSERHTEKTGNKIEKDKDPFKTAKAALKSLKLSYLNRLRVNLDEQYQKYIANNDIKNKKIVNRVREEAQRQFNKLERLNSDELFPDPDGRKGGASHKKFEYKMKSES